MLERFREINGSSEKYKLKQFTSIEELKRILENVPDKNISSFLGEEFRNLLKNYGEDFDYPLALRAIERPFKKSLQRRAAVMIASDSTRARALVIETDSRFKDVNLGDVPPHDVNIADITIWPIQMGKKKPSDKPWYVGPDEEPDPYMSSFIISLKKIGNNDFVSSKISVPGYRHRYWESNHGKDATDLIKDWAGLR
jgi:hypothetical protein